MSTGFVVTHARDAHFERGLRSFFEYRDLGIQRATGGRVNAHVIRAAAGKEFSGQPHLHELDFHDIEMLEIVMPGEFATREVDGVGTAQQAA